MALRLFLVGVVASLALDLPNNGPSPPRSRVRDARAWVETQIARLPEAPPTPLDIKPTPVAVAAVDVLPVDAAKSAMPADEIKPPTPSVTIRPTATVEATLPPAPAAPVEAVVPAPAPAPVVVAEAPKPETPATEPAPMPMPAPEPSAEAVASATPTADAFLPPIASVPVTDPMAPPDSVVDVVPPPVQVIVEAPKPAEPEAPKPADPDAAFRAIVSKMAKQFAADIPAPSAEPKPMLAQADAPIPMSPELAPPPPAAEEIADVDYELFPGFAFAFHRAADGLAPILAEATPAPAEVAPVIAEAAPVAAEPVPMAVAVVPNTEPEPEPAPATVATEPLPDMSRADRLANAVKLTGQAVNAWAALLSQRPAVSALQR